MVDLAHEKDHQGKIFGGTGEVGNMFLMSFECELLKTLDQNYFNSEMKSKAIHNLMAIPQENNE